MVLITFLHDGTIISVAYDFVEAGKSPEKWNLPIVCSIAVLLVEPLVLHLFSCCTRVSTAVMTHRPKTCPRVQIVVHTDRVLST